MIIYLVEAGEYDDYHIDSAWLTPEEAEARATCISRQDGKWAVFDLVRRRYTGHRAWSPSIGPEYTCVVDRASVLAMEVGKV